MPIKWTVAATVIVRRWLFASVLFLASFSAPAFAQTCIGNPACTPTLSYTGALQAPYCQQYPYGPTSWGGKSYMQYSCTWPPQSASTQWVPSIAGCSTGLTQFGNICAIPCEYNSSIAASDPLCVAPPTCAEGQHAEGQDCVPDTPSPEIGSEASEVGIEIGTADASGNITYNSVGESLRAGGSEVYNCGGWECTVSSAGYAGVESGGSGCTQPVNGGAVICGFRPTYTGNEASASSSTVSAPNGGSNVQASSAGCPAGYSLNASGVCAAATIPGTASTATTPGTASTAGAQTCPTGFTADANGVCTGQATTTVQSGGETVCPTGYIKNAVGNCTSTAKIGDEGSPEAGGCGAPGTPACPQMDTTGSMNDVVTGYNTSKSSWFSWVWTPPVGECAPFSGTVHGYSISWNLCPTINNIRDVIGWLFGMFAAITIYGQLFRGHA